MIFLVCRSVIGNESPIVDTPSSYIGEFDDPDLTSIGTGVWYFDRSDNNLVYFVRNTEYFVGEPGVRPNIRFRRCNLLKVNHGISMRGAAGV